MWRRAAGCRALQSLLSTPCSRPCAHAANSRCSCSSPSVSAAGPGCRMSHDLISCSSPRGHRRHVLPAGARGHVGAAKLLAAPAAHDEVGRAARRFGRVVHDAILAARMQAQLGEHVDAAGDGHQLRHPADGADHRVVPFLEVHARPARPRGRDGGDLGVARLAGRDPRLGAIARLHQAGHQPQRGEDLGHAALVGDEHVEAGTDQLVGQRGLHVGEADDEVGLQRHDLVDLAVEEGRHARLLVARAARANGVAGDADDAVLLAEQVQPLGGFFCEADDALRTGHGGIVPGLALANPRVGHVVGNGQSVIDFPDPLP